MSRPKYILFHKPYDVLSQFTEDHASAARTLRSFVPIPGVYPAGRLDRDSEGLLLLTDDGALQHRLSDPRFGHPRTYLAQVEGIPGEDALSRIRSGLSIQGYLTRPAMVRLLADEPEVWERTPPIRWRKQIPTCWLEITLTQGKNRQVRRMTAAIGCPTLRLIRTAIGSLRLEGLAPGQWRTLTTAEISDLKEWKAA